MLKKMTLKKFYFVQIGLLIMFTLLTAGVFVFMNRQIAEADEEQAENVKLMDFLGQKYIDHLHWLVDLKGHVYEGDRFDQALDAAQCDFGKWYYGRRPAAPEEAEILRGFEAPHRQLHEHAREIVAAGSADRKKTVLQARVEPLIGDIRKHVDAYRTYLDRQIADGYATMDRLTMQTQFIALFLMAMLCGGAIGGYFVSRKKLFEPVDKFTATMDRMSGGDLTVRVADSVNGSRDEIAVLAGHMVAMVDNVKGVITKMSESTFHVASASEELSSTADDLNRGSRDLSTLTEQVVTSMTEVSQTVAEVARNASHAADVTRRSSEAAASGKAVVDTATESMVAISETVKTAAITIEELGKNSAQIGDIVTVINGIAEQTNLLALNAAIEAARAGEQGMGFAVVADEVRKLAERTGKATRDISQRIASIQAAAQESIAAMRTGSAEVDRGAEQAQLARKALESIVRASSEAMDMVHRIAAASEEQSTAADEVARNMENISGITRQSSSSAEQVRLSSAELAEQAAKLKEMAAWFKV